LGLRITNPEEMLSIILLFFTKTTFSEKVLNYDWLQTIGPFNNSISTVSFDLTTDSLGNSFTTGITSTSIYNQAKTLNDYFLSGFDTNGKLICGVQDGAVPVNGWTPLSWSYTIIQDSQGYLFISGTVVGKLNGQNMTGDWDYFLMKYDKSCKLIWTRQYGEIGTQMVGKKLTIDSQDNLFLTGAYSKTNSLSQYGYFVAKLSNKNGDVIWKSTVTVTAVGPVIYFDAQGITLDSNGNIYTTGGTNQGGANQIGSTDYFLTKLDSTGKLVWSLQVGVTNLSTWGQAIATDSSNNLYITGSTQGSLSNQTPRGFNDYFLAKYNSNGQLQWSKQNGVVGGNAAGENLLIDSQNNIYLQGQTDSSLITQVPFVLRQDYFIAVYNTTGGVLSLKEDGDSYIELYPHGIGRDGKGNIYSAGKYADWNPLHQGTCGFVSKN